MRWWAIALSERNARALFIPAGLAHGFLALTDDSDVFYQMCDFFAPDAAFAVRWIDPVFGNTWPFEPSLMSERDRLARDFGADCAGWSC